MSAQRETDVRVMRMVMAGVAAIVVLLVMLIWATGPSSGPGQVLLAPNTSFTKGRFFAYPGPWGGQQMWQTRYWSHIGDGVVVDLKRFPRDTLISWRWPPFAPTNGPGVWGYNFVAYGDYASSPTEEPVPPIRVRDLKRLQQSFRWSMEDRWGGADVLTEFFLRSSPTDEAAHRLEVGWFLHTPPVIRGFFEKSQLVGDYRDPAGRHWTVRLSDRYCMFAPVTAGDIPAGEIDMLDALHWLQTRKLVTGDEWLWGLAIGAEPVGGAGRMTLQRWDVAWE